MSESENSKDYPLTEKSKVLMSVSFLPLCTFTFSLTRSLISDGGKLIG